MGMAKAYAEMREQMSFDANEGIYVCENCFDDIGIQEYIRRNSSGSICSYCTDFADFEPPVQTCELDSLLEFMLEGIKLEWTDPNS